jgi:hypothetical protein
MGGAASMELHHLLDPDKHPRRARPGGIEHVNPAKVLQPQLNDYDKI